MPSRLIYQLTETWSVRLSQPKGLLHGGRILLIGSPLPTIIQKDERLAPMATTVVASRSPASL
ncbi:hypothetical protein G7B40_003900 [Aetokthonos hydrillicola Thurmond2011]|uniref:Uncharacterized protein n=1 Tax=Aetokthonos hydrillicola Thurmond2011 TaxID=2712845 RepID=A0AAP5I244_9CYAN|nr:hypothetical protein [Aetokthonos hydrillicola]MBO3457426.1 hypothetical protein [Aetokthonos hydrillicola CCALA 1050]MBW4586052.1 hypothetical protein [Aetokthonos hydrillicola CCALA 1050]MDR9893722.1 hypothetical protein [Aetokthonos hydrillicola Thurmond2011]